jgi:hypothetical protein
VPTGYGARNSAYFTSKDSFCGCYKFLTWFDGKFAGTHLLLKAFAEAWGAKRLALAHRRVP